MKHVFVLLLLILMSGTFPASADTTYSCTAVDRKASVGVKSGTVTITTGDRTCSFSVGGASVDAREPNDFGSAVHNENVMGNNFNSLLPGQFALSNDSRDTLFAMIVGPVVGNDDVDVDRLRSEFESGYDASEMFRCIQDALQSPPSGPRESFSRSGALCGAVTPVDDDPTPAPFARGIVIVGNESLVVLGAQTGTTQVLVFIPTWMIATGQRLFVQ